MNVQKNCVIIYKCSKLKLFVTSLNVFWEMLNGSKILHVANLLFLQTVTGNCVQQVNRGDRSER